MNRIIVVISGILLSISSAAQTEEMNYEKYLGYKDRFYQHFIVTGSENLPGMNIPATIRYYNKNSIKWCDATIETGYYLLFLATEYKIAKWNNEPVNLHLNRINWAMDAIERLDLTAESYFKPCKTVSPDDLNGFFIRDDTDPEILSYNNFQLSSDTMPGGIKGVYSDFLARDPRDKEMSKDQVWSLLIGFAAVINFTNDSYQSEEIEVSVRAKKIVARLIRYLHGQDDWVIYNPITKKPVKRGATVVEPILTGFHKVYFNYGFAEAGNRLCNGAGLPKVNLHTGNSAQYKSEFESQSAWAINFKRDDYSFRALMTIIGDPGYYDMIVNRQKKTGRYEHFRLLYAVLHPSQVPYNKINFSQHYYYQILNSAPINGPYNFGIFQYSDKEWSSTSRLIWPENQGLLAGQNKGAYNGLDYLILYNLYRLVFLMPECVRKTQE